MKPYYEHAGITIWNCDCREVLSTLGPVDLVLTDPPYFRVKGQWWDRQWDDSAAFLEWLRLLCYEWSKLLKTNGSLFLFASPGMSWSVEGVVRQHLHVLNSIRWVKRNGWHQKADEEALRSYLSPWEAIIFAEQYGVDRTARTDYSEAERLLHNSVYSVIGIKIAELRKAAKLERHTVDTACAPSRKPTGLCYRWEEGACLPTEEQYLLFLRLCGDTRKDEALRVEYEALRVEYEALRVEYEALRRPFNLDIRLPRDDIWKYDTVLPSQQLKHPTEKPLALIEDMIRTTCRDDSLILDCFGGSGTTAVAAKRLGFRCTLIEIEEQYCEVAARRLQQEVFEFTAPATQPVQELLL